MIDSDLVRFGSIKYPLLGITANGDEDPDHDERTAAHSRFAHNDGPGAALDRDVTAALRRGTPDLQTRAHLGALHEDVKGALHVQRVITN